MKSRHVTHSFLGIVLLGLSLMNAAHAAHRDLAPIPDDVIQKVLHSANIGGRRSVTGPFEPPPR